MKKLLIVVDYQNDFVTGSLGFEGAKAIESAICDKIRSYQKAGGHVVYTLDTHHPDYADTQEGKKLPVPHCIKDTAGWQLYGDVAHMLQGCRCFEKNTFGSAALLDFLRAEENQYTVIELCGVVTNICVISNAVLAKAAQPEAEIVIDRQCVAGADEEMNQKTFEVLKGLQVTVL
ncbi:cysteine hydrolase family protein [Acidaminobacterium chupaoyuni]